MTRPATRPSEAAAAADKAEAPKADEREAPLYRVAALSHRKPTRFHWRPDAKARAALAKALELQGITAFSFKGEILPEGRSDFRLEARLIADLTQSCVITLAPVAAKIDEAVTRRYLAEWTDPDAEEIEMPEDDSAEALPELISIAAVAEEALSLALPPYPRADGAELGEAVHAEPGTEALRDEDLRPFAGLASLLKKSDKPDSEPDPQQ